MTPTNTIIALEKALEASQLTAGPWQVVEQKIPHRLGGHHVERRIFATWDHPQLKGPMGVVNHSIGVGAEEGAPACHLVQIDAPDAAFIAAANPLAIRTLLDAHASALRDAERYRWLEQRFLGADFRWGADEESGNEGCQTLIFTWPGNPVWGDLSMTLDAAMAALDDNTKGAMSHG